MSFKNSPAVQDALEDCEKSTRKQAGDNLAAEGDKPILNRVDLIGRTIATLERMSRENEERKELLAQIARGGNDVDAARQAIKDDRVSASYCCMAFIRTHCLSELVLILNCDSAGTFDDSVLVSDGSSHG